MPTIALIDDDYATEILKENLGFRGFNVRRFKSASEALDSIQEIAAADLVILDIIMERPPQDDDQHTISGDRTTGMLILKALREKKPQLPILVFSATNDSALIDSLSSLPHTEFLQKWTTPALKEVVSTVVRLLGTDPKSSQLRSFIVHGKDTAEKLALKNFLQNTLRLPEPVILHEQPNLGRTIIEKFEDYASQSDLAFVLLTPDDRVAKADRSNDEKRRARQNVIFELGYFLGVLGRPSGRVFLLYKGPLELPTDLSGIVYIDISGGVEAAGESIRKELESVLRNKP